MKNLIIIAAVILGGALNAQVAIGKSAVDGDAILDFVSGTTSGIILPRVETPTAELGSIIYDVADKKVKYNNGAWVDLSINAGSFDTSEQAPHTEVGDGAIIGADTTTAVGVLVLESPDKALALPKITSPHLNVINPEAGMLCYDTVSKMMCVYNGTEWTFWGV